MVIMPIQGVFKIIHAHSCHVIFNPIILRSFSKASATAQHHNKPLKMERAFCNFDFNMLFAEDENVLSYNLDNAVNTRSDKGTPSSSRFAECGGVQ